MKIGRKMIDVVFLVFVCVILGSFGQVYMKMGLSKTGGIELKELLTKKVLYTMLERHVFIGITLYFISTLLWFVILSKAELSFVYPLIALGYIVTAFLAKHYFAESITPIRWFGILLIIFGASLIIRS
ncbi:MAG: EamA family transporter [Candidatus Aenigmatarchaeota archaeon]